MAREGGTVIENTFTKGLITEATGLNYPEHAATSADNVRFNPKGTVTRRKGLNLEADFEILPYTADFGVVKEFVWNAVAETGTFTFLVLQQGEQVFFYETSDVTSISPGITLTTLDLTDYEAEDAPEIKDIPCSFTSGSGYLFIAHPYLDPIIVRYNDTITGFEAAKITIRIRDFEGVEDGLTIVENPATLEDEHHYNLRNQGWDQQVRVGNVTNDIGAGGANSTPPITVLDWEALP